MRTFKIGLLVTAAVSLLAFSQPAQAVDTFAGTGTDIGATNCHFIASAAFRGTPRINYLNATSDKAASVLAFYQSSAPVKITAAGNSGQAVVTAVGTGNFAAADYVVLRHLEADTYQLLTVSAVTTTNITFVQNLSAAVVSGDLLYKQTAAGTIAVGAATKEINAPGIFNGIPGRPLLVNLDGTSASQINVCAGVYE